MKQPLVTRPVAESKLPSGPPAAKGIPLDKDIPGTSTYNKPEDDIRKPNVEDSSIYRQDDANSLLKDQTVPDERDHDQFKPTFAPPGRDVTPKTKYPNRDGLPHTHNASRMVLGLWALRRAPEVMVPLSCVKTGATLAEVEAGLSKDILKRSRKCRVDLKRADLKNLRWIFAVDSGNGPYAVKLKAKRPRKGVVALDKMDVWFSCSCPAWQWLGSEYHAKQDGYLLGKPEGTVSTPDIKDPERDNKVCKHVAAVIAVVRKWRLGQKRASVRDVWMVWVPSDEMRIGCQPTACRVLNAGMWKTGG